jgi:hypothetical protein
VCCYASGSDEDEIEVVGFAMERRVGEERLFLILTETTG